MLQGIGAFELDVEGRRQEGAMDVGLRLAPSHAGYGGKECSNTGLPANLLASCSNSFSNWSSGSSIIFAASR